MRRVLSLWVLIAIGCTSACRTPEKVHRSETTINSERAIEIAKEAFELYSLDPLSWYEIEVSHDDGAADWCIVFDGTAHSSQLGSSMKVVLVNKKTGRAVYIPGY